VIAARIAALHRDVDDLVIADELGAALLPDDLMPPADTPLYIVADDPVSNLAFAALRRHGAFVIDRNPVAYASSAAVLSAMRRTRSPIRALVLGDPTGDLPQAREEAKEVAARLQVAPLLGSAATGKALLGATGATLIHVAAHTESTPVGSALKMHDGLRGHRPWHHRWGDRSVDLLVRRDHQPRRARSARRGVCRRRRPHCRRIPLVGRGRGWPQVCNVVLRRQWHQRSSTSGSLCPAKARCKRSGNRAVVDVRGDRRPSLRSTEDTWG